MKQSELEEIMIIMVVLSVCVSVCVCLCVRLSICLSVCAYFAWRRYALLRALSSYLFLHFVYSLPFHSRL